MLRKLAAVVGGVAGSCGALDASDPAALKKAERARKQGVLAAGSLSAALRAPANKKIKFDA